jgi:hypothetical protein
VASTPDGVVSSTFEVTSKLDMSPAYAKDGAYVAPLGHGISVDRAYDSEYVMLSGFAPNDTVDLLLFEACVAPAPPPRTDLNAYYKYMMGIKGRVDANGQGFVRIPPEVKSRLKAPPVEYIIVARGVNTPPATFPSIFDSRLERESYDRIVDSVGWFTEVARPASLANLYENLDALTPCSA